MAGMYRSYLTKEERASQSELIRTPPNMRDGDKGKREHATQIPNSYGVTPRYYEPDTPWVEYECVCGKMFWLRSPPSQVRKCSQGGGDRCEGDVTPGGGGNQTRLKLMGRRSGALTVIGHKKGEGWKVRCDCGREKTLINGTLLNNGGYKSCGKCGPEERDGRYAHSDTLRASSFAVIKFADDPKSPLELHKCQSEHPAIYFERSTHHDGCCPLCVMMAKVEMMETGLSEGAR